MRTATLVAGAFVLAVAMQATPDTASITADLACETARELARVQTLTPAPEPAPAPKPAICPRCAGSGKVLSGDGLAILPCPVCKAAKQCTTGTCK
jgi:hypothetical protein